MCGLVGTVGAVLTAKHERAFQDLLIVDTLRGPHSTGIMNATNGGEIGVFKKPLLPNDLFTMEGCKKIFTRANHALIGHNRWATKGAINGVNAHPFEFENLVGAHNGTLINQTLLPDHNNFAVDSENIFYSINKIGLKDTVAKLHGAYALTWYDKKHRSINFIRNKERPLYVTFTKDSSAMFWASEAWMLSGVLGMNGIEHKDIFDTVIHTHYELKIPKGEHGKPDTFVLPHFTKTDIEPWVPPYRPKSHYPAGNVVNGRFMRNTTGGKENGKRKLPAGWEYDIGETVHFFLDPDSPRNKRFVLGMLGHNMTKKVKIHAGKQSWLRGNLECDDVDEVTYHGIVNGYSNGYLMVQENSVYTTASNDTIEETPKYGEGMSPEQRNDQVMALLNTKGTCSWCGDPILPNKDNTYLNSDTIICQPCVNNDAFVQKYIEEFK